MKTRLQNQSIQDLAYAAFIGNVEKVNVLLKEGTPVNGVFEGVTALCAAVQNQHINSKSTPSTLIN